MSLNISVLIHDLCDCWQIIIHVYIYINSHMTSYYPLFYRGQWEAGADVGKCGWGVQFLCNQGRSC